MAHAWMPTSPCGPGCLDASAPRVGGLRAVLRMAAAACVLGAAMLGIPALLLLRGRARERYVRTIFRAVLRAFGVRLIVHGDGLEHERGRGALVVNNHISWLDIVAVSAMKPMRALAKSEIAAWPVLGALVSRAGTVFVDRERLSTLPGTVSSMTDALREGSLVNVSGEGTTWCGRASGRFVPAPFQAAIDGGVPVRPLALRYRLACGRETTQPAFIGTETLVDSVRRVAALRGLVVEVFVCDEIAPGRAADRRELAVLTELAVQSALGSVRVLDRPPVGAGLSGVNA